MAWNGALWAALLMFVSIPAPAADLPDLWGRMVARSAQRMHVAGTLDGVFAALQLPETPESAERIQMFLLQADELIGTFNVSYELGVIQLRAYLATRGQHSVVRDFDSTVGMQDARDLLLAQLKELQTSIFGRIGPMPGRPVGTPTPADVYFDFAVSQMNFKLKIDPVYTEDYIRDQRAMYDTLFDIAALEPTTVREFTQGVCIRALH